MRRLDFSRESEIVGEDFSEVIKKYGGKNAGLLLAKKIWYNKKEFPRGDAPLMIKNIPIPTILYKISEEILQDSIREPMDEEAFLKMDISEMMYQHKNFRDELDKNIRRCKRAFGKYSQESEYYIRSSTTLEDFVDDRYYGTFETMQRRKCFKKNKRNQKLSLIEDMITLIQRFYAMKHYTEGFFELQSDESLGIMVMPSIPGLHIISYSSYPEIKGSPVIHEISKINDHDHAPDPLVLIKVHGDTIKDIEIIPATADAYSTQDPQENIFNFPDTYKSHYEYDNPFEINGVRSPISHAEIRVLTHFSRRGEHALSYSVNTELKLVRHEYYSNIYLVQLRPTPVIENFSPLPPLQDSQILLSETPFVYGAFSYCAPVLMTEDKNVARAGISINKSVIVLDSDRQKGHRLFWGNQGDNCLALINPKQGRTLSHGYAIVPPFGKYRKKFHAIGAPRLKDLYQENLVCTTH